tara:strand:+ start:435 stop:1592 length:1158 start_codon:yes stop_codon:yes gene_type:complete
MSRNTEQGMNEFALLDPKDGLPLFYPFIAPETYKEVKSTLNSRWIGQGPKVDEFEKQFASFLNSKNNFIATGSGTDSLHLAYILAGIKPGDEVITPVFTCTATNLPLLYEGAIPIFADIDPETLNINFEDIEHRITTKTKAIVAVDYGGIPAKYDKLLEICKKYNLKLIADCAQSIGSKYKNFNSCEYADFAAYSFQAIKTITTSDGGMLSIKDPNLLDKAKRLRWFGIDRSSKQKGNWENDIKEIGFKYQMTDLAACLGLSSLKHITELIEIRRSILKTYVEKIDNHYVKVLNKNNDNDYLVCPWLCTLIVKKDRYGLMEKLRKNGIESAQVHYRNDRYSIFGGRKVDLKTMDKLEENYLVIPIHHKVTIKQAEKICELINEGW